MKEFDLVVIGSGSGLDVASGALSRGMEVAVVEKDPVGGTCLTRGCIPSKKLIHRADVHREIERSERFGIESRVESVDFAGMVEEVNGGVMGESEELVEAWEEAENGELFRGKAVFVDERTLEVGGEELRGDTVVIASGSRPVIPELDGLEAVDYLTSREALELEECPESLVVVGGGYIGAELGHFFGSLGSDVKIIGRSGLVPNEDRDVREFFAEKFEERFDIYDGYEAFAVEEGDEGVEVAARGEGGDEVEVSGEELLIAAGRRPNGDLLEAGEGGVEVRDDGAVVVDEYLETTAEDTWALGDVIGNPMYKHSANMEAQAVYFNALTEHRHPVDYSVVPHAIFSEPQVGGVGKTEGELEGEDVEYVKSTYRYGDTAMGQAFKEGGLVKVLADPRDGSIHGCHVVGPRASMLIHEVVVAMECGGGVDSLIRAIHVHPALNEVVDRAFDRF